MTDIVKNIQKKEIDHSKWKSTTFMQKHELKNQVGRMSKITSLNIHAEQESISW